VTMGAAFPEPQLRVALLTDGIHPFVVGGIQRHSRMLAEHLTRLGVRVRLFHTTTRADTVAAATNLDGCDPAVWNKIATEFVPYPKPGTMPGHYVGDSARYSEALLERFRPAAGECDFIYAQGFTGLAFVKARGRGDNLPPVGVNLHGYEMFQTPVGVRDRLSHMLLRPTARQLTRHADVVFSFPGRIRSIVNRIGVSPQATVCELPNGIDDAWLVDRSSPSHRPRRFIFIGRNERRKAYPEIIRAIAAVPEALATFSFVGDIPEESRLDRGNITYHGRITEQKTLQSLLDASDVLMCPSHSEGMPTVILEALARGVAILATDVGSVAEMVDERVGILIPQPTAAGIRHAIDEFIAMSDESLDSMKAAGPQRAAGYAWETVARKTAAAISEVVRRPSRISAATRAVSA